jgi:hypothetical protein
LNYFHTFGDIPLFNFECYSRHQLHLLSSEKIVIYTWKYKMEIKYKTDVGSYYNIIWKMFNLYIFSSLISLLWYFQSSLGTSAFVDRHSDGGVHFYSWSSRAVHFFGRWVPSTSLISAAHLARVRLSGMNGAKS